MQLMVLNRFRWVFCQLDRLRRCLSPRIRRALDELPETFDEDWRPEDSRDTVLSTCSSLIAVVNVGDSLVMQFSHFSVKEYLTSTRIAEGRVSRYYIPL